MPRLLTVAWICRVASPLAAADKPNIIMIMADDVGFECFSAYGSREYATPRLDALAAGGIRLTNGYVTGTWCSPSRAALMTGRYQQRFGVE